MNETQWTRQVCEEMEACNAMVVPYVASAMGRSGTPDRYVCHTYWAGWIEFKGTNTTVTDGQRVFIRDHNFRQPGTAFVVRFGGRVEDHEGRLMTTFDGSGRDLIAKLSNIRDGMITTR